MIFLVYILAGLIDFFFKERWIASYDYNWELFYKHHPFMKDNWSFCIYLLEVVLFVLISLSAGNGWYMLGILATLNEDMLYYLLRAIFYHKKLGLTFWGQVKATIAGKFYYPFGIETSFKTAIVLWILSTITTLWLING